MQEEHYSITQLLNTLVKRKGDKVKKRFIFDQSPIGGIGSKWVIAFFISLPIFLYIGIFNPTVFAMLGIAQAIIFYVVFLSMVMILIIAVTFINNNKVLRQIKPSWDTYFPGIELRQLLSSGATPYKDFFKHYTIAINQDLKDEELYTFLKEAFSQMEDENRDLLDMLNKAKDA